MAYSPEEWKLRGRRTQNKYKGNIELRLEEIISECVNCINLAVSSANDVLLRMQ
jgi:hypothetical protein